MALLRSFSFALAGLRYLVRTQRNFRIELIAGGVVLLAGTVSALAAWEWVALVLTITLVLVLEAVNTAVEAAVTLARPQFDPTARAAKDVSAAAVLVAAMGAVAVGLLVFAPRLRF